MDSSSDEKCRIEQLQIELRDKILKLNSEKAQANIDRMSAEAELSALNHSVRGQHVTNYGDVCRRQANIKNKLVSIRKRSMALGGEAAALSAEEHKLHIRLRQIERKDNEETPVASLSTKTAEVERSVSAMKAICEMKDRYLKFAEDGSRISSMRLMATRFANELQEIIDEYC